jgi:glycosyltransferase A (GT-A) superfamily protein (DUF2064 family)
MRNTLVVFTKVPVAGETKTRLTTARGGILTAEEAMQLYEGILLDVINVCIKADIGDVWICYNQKGDLGYLEKLLAQLPDRSGIKGIYHDEGGSFDECMQYAAEYILKNGSADRISDSVVIVGGDLPSMQPYILQDTYRKLKKLAMSEAGKKAAQKKDAACPDIGAALVEGACQEGGFSIVGFTCATPFDFHKVFYNTEAITALDMLVDKAVAHNIPLAVVEAVPDVDIPVDLASSIPVLNALQVAAPHDETIIVPVNTMRLLEEIGLTSSAFPPER